MGQNYFERFWLNRCKIFLQECTFYYKPVLYISSYTFVTVIKVFVTIEHDKIIQNF